MRRVVVVGVGFAGLNVARVLARSDGVEVVLLDRRNHHLFQPLLYQVAMAGLSPADIAVPIRGIASSWPRTQVRMEEMLGVDLDSRVIRTDHGTHAYDYLVLATGTQDSYFGHEQWAPFAPGLKSLDAALDIRRRVLEAYERAEIEDEPERQKALLTFVIVGGGPTGVELAGALGEMSRFTLARDFRRIDPRLARVILVEAGPRILPSFPSAQASRAARELETLGVQIWTSSRVSGVDAKGVDIATERLAASTVVWAAGVRASPLGACLGVELDPQGRVPVGPDLSLAQHPEVFVAGDLAHCVDRSGRVLPGLAPVALQQGRFIGHTILSDLQGQPRKEFRYADKGQLATIGRSRAVAALRRVQINGLAAWLLWLMIHIYYLVGFKNRLLVVLQWAWSYVTWNRGARLIVRRESEPAGLPLPDRPDTFSRYTSSEAPNSSGAERAPSEGKSLCPEAETG